MGAFGFGLPSVSLGTGGGAGFGFGPDWSETRSAVPEIPTPGIDTGSWKDIITSGIATGLSAWKTKLQYDLLNKQINKGQSPSRSLPVPMARRALDLLDHGVWSRWQTRSLRLIPQAERIVRRVSAVQL
jgi:hypothetical protein